MDVGSLAPEHRVRLNVHAQVQVAAPAAVRAGRPLACHADARPVLDTGRNLDIDCARLGQAVTPGLRQFDPSRDARQDFAQGQPDVGLQILCRHGGAPERRSARPARSSAEQVLEDVAEIEPLLGREFRAALPPPGGPAPHVGSGLLAGFLIGLGFLPARPVPVILLPRLRITEDFVGLVEFLEFCLHLRLARAGVEIRMVLARQFAIGLLDLVLRGGSGDAQDVVVISLRGRHRGTRLSFVLAAYGVRAVFSSCSWQRVENSEWPIASSL